MALPQDDPSLPSNPAPLFSDTDAVRGDHQRANNQYIWENLEYLNDGENINDADAATPVDADRLGFWQIAGSILRYVTFANLFLWIGTKIAALSTKATPVDADSVVIVDSENSNVLKRVLFSALKTFFKTYFDGYYPTMVYTAPASQTATGTGFGTISGLTYYSWRIGALLHFEIRYVSGTHTSTEARFELKHAGASVSADSTYPTIQLVGYMVESGNANNYACMVEASQSYIVFTLPALTPLAKLNATVFGNNSTFTICGAVRIQGW